MKLPTPTSATRPGHTPPDRQRRRLLAASALLLAAPAGAARADDPLLRRVLAGPQRPAVNRARDAARHPAQTLRFFGLEPTLTVLELSPGGGWYTEILAPYLRERGELRVAHAARDAADEYSRRGRANFDARLAADPAVFDRVRVGTLPDHAGFVAQGPVFSDLGAPGSVDLILSFRNLHNWLEDGRLDDILRASHALLKPGGVLGLVDHRAPRGTPVAQQKRSGYTSEAVAIAAATGAGFRLDARSEINANPRDTHEHPDGVWSLPPTLRGGERDRARFLAIGESDRFTHRYRKPAAA